MDYPKISIITPSFNQGKYIEKTIQSILDQNYPNLEYIIIDGGSTDETIEIIKKYEHKIKYWVSEKDGGQTDAINKGLKYCTGDIFNWINSDDYLSENALFTIAKGFMDHPSVGMVAGAVQNFNEKEGIQLFINRNLCINGILSTNWDYLYHQPGVWLRMETLRAAGIFRIDYHYCFDLEFLLRYLLLNDQVFYTNEKVAYFRLHELSKTVTYPEKFALENKRLFREFYLSQKGKIYYEVAKRKSNDFEWGLDYTTIRKKYKSRLGAFIAVFIYMLKTPQQFKKNHLGSLKHILFGEE